MKPYRLKKGSPQWDFAQCRAKIQGFCGSYANGKSTAMIVSKALKLVIDYPGCLGLMSRATYPKLNDTFRKDFLQWCPPSWVRKYPTKDDNTIYLKNDSVIHFRYVAQRGKTNEAGDTTSNLLSGTYDFILVDQLEDPEFEHKDFLDLLGRLRGDTPYKPNLAKGEREDETLPLTGPRWLGFGANPGRGWLFSEVIKPYLDWRNKGVFSEKLLVDAETNYPIMELIEGDLYSNADNLEEDYIKTLEVAYKGQMAERYIKGKWAAFEGLVYDTFDERSHVVNRAKIIKHLHDCVKRHVKVRVLEAYDFGLISPTCYLLAFVDDLGRVFILDGFYEPNFGYDKHASRINEIRSKYIGLLTPKDAIEADPSIWRKQVVAGMPTGTSIYDLLKRELRMRPANNDIQAGIAKVASYWSGRVDVPHIVTTETPGPMMYVCDELTWYTDEILDYFWKKNPAGDRIDEPSERNDHAMDATKYLLSRLPEASKIVLPKHMLPPSFMFWREMDDNEYRRASRM